MRKNKLLGLVMAVLLALAVTGCSSQDGGVSIDVDAMTLVDEYLNDPKVSAFHERLKISRQNIIRNYEQAFTAENKEKAKLELVYDEGRYDPDFENRVEVKLSSRFPMQVRIKGPFIDELILVQDKTSKTYAVKGVDKDELKVVIVEVLPRTDEYKTKKYWKTTGNFPS